MGKLLFERESFELRGAVYEVYQELGCGFLESVYQEALEYELDIRRVPFVAQPELQIYYKGSMLNQKYVPDLICFNSIIVELKAVKELLPEHTAQLHNYLKATGLRLGFLVNFDSHPKVEITRIIL